MSEFIVNEESFKLGVLDRVPVPDDGECFLLYQMGAGKKASFVIYNGIRYSSTEIRHKRCNRKATISLGTKSIIHKQRVVMKDRDFYFDVTVQVSYALQDVAEYFFSEQIEEEDIRQVIRKIIRRHDGEWDIQQSWDAQSNLESELSQGLRKYESLKFRIMDIQVLPDEAAAKMLQSNRNKTVGIHVAKNETDEKIAKNEQTGRILDSESGLKMKKMQEMAVMMKNFGSLGPIVEEYFKGNMSGTDLYNYIMKAKTDDLSMLNTAVSNDWLSQEEAMAKLNEILGENKFFPEGERRQVLGEKKTEAESVEEETEGDIFHPEDGDYI